MSYKYLSAIMMFYICGIICCSLGFPSFIISVMFLGILVSITKAKTKKSIIISILFTLCFSAGYLHTFLQNSQYNFFYETFCDRYVTVFGTVDSMPIETETLFGEKNLSYTVKLSDVKVDGEFYKSDKKIIVYAPDGIFLEPGDTVILNGFLRAPKENANPNGFNYRKYLQTTKTAAIMNLRDGVVTGKNTSLFYKLSKVRHHLLVKLSQYMPEDKDFLVRALVLGDRTQLSSDVENTFAGSGISHALALSGMHLSILMAFVTHFIARASIKLRARAVICSVAVILYIPVAGFFPSLVRAGIITLFAFAATLFKQKYDFTTALVFAATVILMDNPLVIHSLSFQLSFLATIGIVYFSLPAYKLFKQKIRLNRFTGFISVTAISSITVTLLTLPIIAKSFSSVSFYTILGNILIVPLIEILFAGALVMLTIGVIFAPAAKIIGMALAFITDIILFACNTVSSLKGAFFVVKAPGIFEYMLYLSAVCAAYGFLRKSKFKKPAAIIACAMAVLCISNSVYQSTVFRVDFINVGQGDSALIQIPFGKNILIDCGPAGYGEAASYIKSKGIHTLDAIYISHFDSDHTGGLDEILSSVTVKKVVVSYTNAQNSDSFELLNKIINSGADVEFADNTYHTKIGSCEIEALWPGDIINTDDNNNSLVIKLKCRGKTFLFTGDIDAQTEHTVINAGKNVNTDVLKVAHHGSKTSTSSEFIKHSSPQYAVISVSNNNSFGHPDSNVINRLEAEGCHVFSTAKNGYAHFSQDMFGNYKIKIKNLD